MIATRYRTWTLNSSNIIINRSRNLAPDHSLDLSQFRIEIKKKSKMARTGSRTRDIPLKYQACANYDREYVKFSWMNVFLISKKVLTPIN